MHGPKDIALVSHHSHCLCEAPVLKSSSLLPHWLSDTLLVLVHVVSGTCHVHTCTTHRLVTIGLFVCLLGQRAWHLLLTQTMTKYGRNYFMASEEHRFQNKNPDFPHGDAPKKP